MPKDTYRSNPNTFTDWPASGVYNEKHYRYRANETFDKLKTYLSDSDKSIKPSTMPPKEKPPNIPNPAPPDPGVQFVLPQQEETPETGKIFDINDVKPAIEPIDYSNNYLPLYTNKVKEWEFLLGRKVGSTESPYKSVADVRRKLRREGQVVGVGSGDR